MKPVMQTLFGKNNGNCLPACLASILEIPLEAVPHFCRLYDDDHWAQHMSDWLRKHFGLAATICTFDDDIDVHEHLRGIWHLMAGPSPRDPDCKHSVVAYQGEIAHDPCPDGEKLETIEDYTFFIACDPAKTKRTEGAEP